MPGKTKAMKALGFIGLAFPPVALAYAMVECIRTPHTAPAMQHRPALY